MIRSPIVNMQDVTKRYRDFLVLDRVSTQVHAGEVVVVCGPSGSGKSTLLKTLNGLESFQSGVVRVDGVDVGGKGADLTALRSRVGMVFQTFELFPHLTVIQNLMLAQVKVLGRSKAEAADRGAALLQRVGLADQRLKYPTQLSGGQQQRVAIARALAMDPVLMLFDEPTSSLDPEMIGEVLDVMTALADDGMTMLCVTHEMGFARRVSQRVLFMDQGRIDEDVEAERFFGQIEERKPRAKEFLRRIMH